MISLLKDALITRVVNETAAGTSAINGTALDMQGFDSILVVALLGAVTDGSVMTLSVLSNPTNSNSGGTTEVAGDPTTAAASSNKVMAVECLRPSQRYVYANFTRSAQNAEVNGILAIQFNAKNVPQTQAILDAVLGGPKA